MTTKTAIKTMLDIINMQPKSKRFFVPKDLFDGLYDEVRALSPNLGMNLTTSLEGTKNFIFMGKVICLRTDNTPPPAEFMKTKEGKIL